MQQWSSLLQHLVLYLCSLRLRCRSTGHACALCLSQVAQMSLTSGLSGLWHRVSKFDSSWA